LKPYEKLQRYWRETDAEVETIELSQSQVQVLETRYGIFFPEDFKDYLMRSCPKDDFAVDNRVTAWWPWGRIKSIPDERDYWIREGSDLEITDESIARDDAKYIVFADYAIWCMAWAICCDEGPNRGKVAVLSGRDRFVADDFAQFVDLYIQDVHQLL
jgi:hypothetical protein